MTGPLRTWVALLGLVVGVLVAPRAAIAQETHLLVVTGLGGDPEYTEQFHDWARTLVNGGHEPLRASGRERHLSR